VGENRYRITPKPTNRLPSSATNESLFGELRNAPNNPINRGVVCGTITVVNRGRTPLARMRVEI